MACGRKLESEKRSLVIDRRRVGAGGKEVNQAGQQDRLAAIGRPVKVGHRLLLHNLVEQCQSPYQQVRALKQKRTRRR